MAAFHGDITGAMPAGLPSLYLQFPTAGHMNISALTPRAPKEQFLKAAPGRMAEGKMTKESCISLIAGVALLGMGTISIASAFDPRVETGNESGITIAQLYVSNVGTRDGSGHCDFGSRTLFRDGTDVAQRNADVCAIEKYTLTD